MDQQVSIEKESARKVGMISEIGENSSRRFVRQRSVSGPGSEGEKSLLKKNPGWLISPKVKLPVFISCLSSLDEVVATPSFNVSVIESACYKDFKFFDAINNSKYVASIDSAIAGLGLFAVSIGVYIVKYSKLREIERHSNYFYFNRLFKAYDEEEIKNKMEFEPNNDAPKDPISFEHLLTASYFYPPDISKIASWRRRFFASGKEKLRLKSLNYFLNNNSKKETLNKLHNKITEKVCRLLNKETESEYFKTKEYKDHWTIVLSDNYAKKFFKQIKSLIKDNSKKTKENNDKINRNFLPAILSALGQASFIYWILMFIFCFIPMAPVVTTALISIVPLGIALLGALPLLLFFEIKNTHETYKSKKNLTEEMIETQHKHMLEKKLVDLNKQKIFFALLSRETNSTVKLKNSSLMKDLQTVLKSRRFSKYHAMCMGFLDGCFLPLFAGWLLLDGTKVILTYILCPLNMVTGFTPIGLVATAIIVAVTLLIGISYGIYSANKAKQIHEDRFKELEIKVTALKDELPNKKILNKSLREYDRVLRRFSDEQPKWTGVKKGLSRFLVIIKRLGTGSLVFRLVIWGPISTAVAASTAVIPAFFPIILIVGTAIGALVIALWYVYAYHLESKVGRAGRIVEYFVQTEQLDCFNTDLKKKLADESLDVENDIRKIEVASEKLAKLPGNETQFSRSEVTQKGSISDESDDLDEFNNAKMQVEKGIQGNQNLHGLFKNIQTMDKSDQDIEVCLSNTVISC